MVLTAKNLYYPAVQNCKEILLKGNVYERKWLLRKELQFGTPDAIVPGEPSAHEDVHARSIDTPRSLRCASARRQLRPQCNCSGIGIRRRDPFIAPDNRQRRQS